MKIIEDVLIYDLFPKSMSPEFNTPILDQKLLWMSIKPTMNELENKFVYIQSDKTKPESTYLFIEGHPMDGMEYYGHALIGTFDGDYREYNAFTQGTSIGIENTSDVFPSVQILNIPLDTSDTFNFSWWPSGPYGTVSSNKPVNTNPFKEFIVALQNDKEMQWSYHCNIACAIMDEGIDSKTANLAAERFMGTLLGGKYTPIFNLYGDASLCQSGCDCEEPCTPSK